VSKNHSKYIPRDSNRLLFYRCFCKFHPSVLCSWPPFQNVSARVTLTVASCIVENVSRAIRFTNGETFESGRRTARDEAVLGCPGV
jgi:hypothetical protein